MDPRKEANTVVMGEDSTNIALPDTTSSGTSEVLSVMDEPTPTPVYGEPLEDIIAASQPASTYIEQPVDQSYFNDAVFLGDSRTVGLELYSGWDNCDYLADVGMTIYDCLNLIIEESDHPLLIKVASIQTARIQIYFIDNDDLFHRRKGVADEAGVEYADNDDRVIFYARGVIETVKKLRWTPNIILCSGWMSALAPLYLKKAYSDEPFFAKSKIVLMLDDNEYKKPFPTRFTEKLRIEGISNSDVRSIDGFPIGYEELMRLAIDFSDAIVYATPHVNQRLMNYAETKGKPSLPYQETEDVVAACQRQYDFYQRLLETNE